MLLWAAINRMLPSVSNKIWKQKANKSAIFCSQQTIVLSLVDLYLWKTYLHSVLMLLLIQHCFHEELLIATDKDFMLSTTMQRKCQKSVLMTLTRWFSVSWARIQIFFSNAIIKLRNRTLEEINYTVHIA